MTHELNVAESLLIVVAIVAATLKLFHARRPGANVPAVRAMCGSIIAMGICIACDAGWVVPHLESVFGVSLTYALRHTPALISVHLLRRAFLCWVWLPGPTRTRRLRWHLGILSGVIITRWALALVTPDADAHAALSPQSDWSDAPLTAVAMVLYASYMGWCALSVAYLSWIWSRETSTRRWTRVGLRLIVVSTTTMTLYLLHKLVVLMLVVGTNLALPYNQYTVEAVMLVIVCSTLFAGLGVPLVATGLPAAVRIARDHGHYRRVLPLWAALTHEDRNVILRCHPRWIPTRLARWWETFSLLRVGFRLYHRLIECTDIVHRLHRHLDADAREHVRLLAEQAGHPTPFAYAIADAVTIKAAFRRRRQRRPALPPEQRAAPLADQDSISLAENLQWWLGLAAAWHSPVTTQLAKRLGVMEQAH